MKKILFIISFLFLAGLVSAQNSLSFSYDVDKDGNTTTDAAKFSIRNGDPIKMIVRNPKEFRTTQLQYKVYRLNCSGEKSYDVTFYQDVHTDWVWAWKEILCHSSDFYYIEVLNADGRHLCDGTFYVTVY